MPCASLKLLCLVLVVLQGLAAVASAAGVRVCLHADGTSCVEIGPSLAACCDMARLHPACEDCRDLPADQPRLVRSSDETARATLDVFQHPPALPVLQLAPASPEAVSSRYATDPVAVCVPDPGLQLLHGIVLLT